MTASEALRAWALRLRPLAELQNGEAEFAVAGGAKAVYRLGEGLTYTTPRGTEFHYSEDALDAETYEVTS